MIALALKAGVMFALLTFLNSPSLVSHYLPIIALLGCTISVLLYVGGLKDGLRYVGIILVAYIILRVIFVPTWVLPAQGQITQYFNANAAQRHDGLDIAAGFDEDVHAALEGKVSRVWFDKDGYGNVLTIDHGNGIQSLYGHNNEILVKVGDSVTKETVIAKAGSSGHSSGPHVHFEILKNGKAQNPTDYIKLGGG